MYKEIIYNKYFRFVAALSLGFLVVATAQSAQLANYIGTEQDSIRLELSDNGPKSPSFSIRYRDIKAVPSSSDRSKDWTSWNVKDKKNYYGTITFHSDGRTVTFGDYKGGDKGFYLKGVNFDFNPAVNAYQITADEIHRGEETSGPFSDAKIATPAVYPGTDKRIILSVSGTEIVNNNGKTILLKGMVRPSLEWNPEGQLLNPDDIQKIHEWKSNVIRIDLYQNYWFTSRDKTVKGSYKQIIDAIIYYATLNNMAVILDLHWTEYGHQNPMANKGSVRFWKEVAAEYKDFGTVIFELFNEPVSISRDVWLRGDHTYAGYQELYDAVRSTGAQNICIINGLDYGWDLSFVNDSFGVKGTNLVYGAHPYNGKGGDGYSGPGGTFDHNFRGLSGKYPLILTEFGVNVPKYFPHGFERIYREILDYARKHNISYTGFAWWVGDAHFPSLIEDWKGTARYGGTLIKADMEKQPGTPINH